MANIPKYRCSACLEDKQREELTVKKVVFLEMGAGAPTKRSRVLAWLCDECLNVDETYNLPAFTSAVSNA